MQSAKKQYKKKSASAAAASKKKSTVRSIVRQPKVNVYSDSFVHRFKMLLDDGVFTTTGATSAGCTNNVGSTPNWVAIGSGATDAGGIGVMQYGFATQVILQSLSGYATYQNLFHEFMIEKIDWRFTSCCGDSYNSGAGCTLPTIYTVQDAHDANVPATFQEVQQYESCREFQLTQNTPSYKRTIVPQIAVQVFAGAMTTGYGATQKPLWLDTSNPGPTLPFYSLKGWVRGQTAAVGAGFGFRLQPTVYLAFRRVR